VKDGPNKELVKRQIVTLFEGLELFSQDIQLNILIAIVPET
jgi:hypothetical protein